MSTEQAHAFIQRVLTDADFRERLESAPIEQRREIIVSEGFGDVRLRHISQALPESAGGELTDEEFAAVAGGGHTVTYATIGAAGGFTAGSAAVGMAVIGMVAAA